MKIITSRPQQTHQLGQKFSRTLKGGEILAFSGELGAGKTVFIKGLAAGLGIKQTVRSPSFNLMKIYHIIKTLKPRTRTSSIRGRHKNKTSPAPPNRGGSRGGRQFIHLDCYRLKSETEAIDLGLLDYLGRPDTIIAIEWAEKIAPLLKKHRFKKIKIIPLKKNRRKIIL